MSLCCDCHCLTHESLEAVCACMCVLVGVSEDGLENMEAIALKRGFILPGKRIDYERCARTILDEFRSGLIGNITLEKA